MASNPKPKLPINITTLTGRCSINSKLANPTRYMTIYQTSRTDRLPSEMSNTKLLIPTFNQLIQLSNIMSSSIKTSHPNRTPITILSNNFNILNRLMIKIHKVLKKQIRKAIGSNRKEQMGKGKVKIYRQGTKDPWNTID